MRDQIGYSDQELYESREEEPNRPECGTRVPGQIRPWWYINFLKAIGCATVEDRLDALERER
ncbi:MAG TPA: hypothetical protein VFA32_18910 [Dehalococcoidia bacterium]|nr:hypothetical protein [Dehalococcoidia bacterium]